MLDLAAPDCVEGPLDGVNSIERSGESQVETDDRDVLFLKESNTGCDGRREVIRGCDTFNRINTTLRVYPTIDEYCTTPAFHLYPLLRPLSRTHDGFGLINC